MAQRSLIILLLNLTSCLVFAQNSSNNLKVYIDENAIDFNFIRNKIEFADFVNDPITADVHILIIEEPTGSGGTNYSIWFNNRGVKNIKDYTLSTSVIAEETEHHIREKLAETIIRGLMPYLNEMSNAHKYKLSFEKIDDQTTVLDDNWKNWVFSLTSSGGFDYEENRSGYDYSIYLKADKVTEKIKINNYIYIDNEVIKYKGVDYEYRYNYKYGFTKCVYSLSDHWSTGITMYSYQSTYHNTKFALAASQAIEYNVFPWQESNRRVFTIAYALGYESLSFFEKNYLGNYQAQSPMHRLYIEASTIQPWGEIAIDISGAEYFNKLSLYNLSAGAEISFRIVKGLSLTFEFLAESIHNQIYIPESAYSVEEIISSAIKLPSTYELGGSIGITYQFGSIYNNIVNRRL